MNISGISPNIGEIAGQKSGDKGSVSRNNIDGPNFSQRLADVARSANISIAGETSSGSLNFMRQKERFDELFSYEENDERRELNEHYLLIKKLLDQFQK